MKEPGIKLVNRYAETVAKIKDLHAELRTLREECVEIEEALLARADKEKLEVIIGSDHDVTISQRTQTTLPRKTYKPEEYGS